MKQGRFAAAGRSHKRNEVAGFCIEAYPAQSRDRSTAAVVSLFHAVDNKNWQMALEGILDYQSITWRGRTGKFGRLSI